MEENFSGASLMLGTEENVLEKSTSSLTENVACVELIQNSIKINSDKQVTCFKVVKAAERLNKGSNDQEKEKLDLEQKIRNMIATLAKTTESQTIREQLTTISRFSSVPFSKMFAGRSLLFHIVHSFEEVDAEKCIQGHIQEIFTRNTIDGLLPIHASLERGSEVLTSVLCEKMFETTREPPLNLELITPSLMRKVLNNICSIEIRNNDSDHIACLKILLKQRSDGTSLLTDYIWSSSLDLKFRKSFLKSIEHVNDDYARYLLEEAALLRFSSRNQCTTPLSWTNVDSILKLDSRERLEVLLSRYEHRPVLFLRPKPSTSGQTILHAAVQHKSIRCLTFLFGKYAMKDSINIPDVRGDTPLHYIAKLDVSNSSLLLLKMFLNAGASASARNNEGDNCLHLLMIRNSGRLIIKEIGLYVTTILENRSINFTSSNILGISLHNFQQMRNVNDTGSQDDARYVKHVDDLSESLMFGSFPDTVSMVSSFLQLSSLGRIPEFLGAKTLLYYVSVKCSAEHVESFISLGCNPCISNIDDGKVPLHAAMTRCDPKMIRILLNAMGKCDRSFRWFSASLFVEMFCAVLFSKKSLMTNFLESFWIVLNFNPALDLYRQDRFGVSLCQLVNYIQIPELNSMLALKETSDIRQVHSNLNWNEMQELFSNDNADLFALEILKNNRMMEDIFCRQYAPKKSTLLHVLVSHSSLNILEFLSRVGGISNGNINKPDEDGRSALHIAVEILLAKQSVRQFQIVKLLLDHGGWIDAMDNFGRSAFDKVILNVIMSPIILTTTVLALVQLLVNCGAATYQSYNNPKTIRNLVAILADEHILDFQWKKLVVENLIEYLNKYSVFQLSQTKASISRLLYIGKLSSDESKSINELFEKYSANDFKYWYIGSTPVSHCIVRHLAACSVETLLPKLNSEMIDIKSEKTLLHEALTRGDPELLVLVLTSMDKKSDSKWLWNLKNISFSLLRTVLCSSPLNPSKTDSADHNKCLRLLFEFPNISLDINQCLSPNNAVTALHIARLTRNRVAENILRAKGASDYSSCCFQDRTILSWTTACSICVLDDIDKLALELALRGNKTKYYLRPDGALHKKTLMHCMLDYRAIHCLEFLARKLSNNPMLLDEPNDHGESVLHYAVKKLCRQNSVELLRMIWILVKSGSSTDCRDQRMNTPHHLINSKVAREHVSNSALLEVVDMLLSSNFNDLISVNCACEVPYNMATEDIRSKYKIYMNDYKGCKKSIENLSYLIHSLIFQNIINEDVNGLTQLMKEAFKSPHVQIKNRFIGTKSLLYWFAYFLPYDYVSHILKIWRMNPWTANIDEGTLPLHAAVQNANLAVAHVLLQHMKLSETTLLRTNFVDLRQYSFSLLKKVICNLPHLDLKEKRQNYCAVLSRLMEPDVILDLDLSFDNITLCDLALSRGWKEAIQMLGKESDVNKTNVGITSLYNGSNVRKCLLTDNREMLEIILCHNSLNDDEFLHPLSDGTRRTIFHHAVCTKECMTFLLQTNIFRTQLDIPDSLGMSPFHFAIAEALNANSFNALLSAKKLLRAGADVNTRNGQGDSPLHTVFKFAVNNQEISDICRQVLDLLINCQMLDINAVNGVLQTPAGILVNSLSSGSRNLITHCKQLLNRGASLDKLQKMQLEHFCGEIVVTRDFPPISWENELINKLASHDSILCRCHALLKNGSICNKYIGAKSIFFKLIEWIPPEYASEMIRTGADPWIRNTNDGRMPLHMALSGGKPVLVSVLLSAMRNNKKVNVLDLRNDTYTLLQAVFCNILVVCHKSRHRSKEDYVKCLMLLFNAEVLLDTEQIRMLGDVKLQEVARKLTKCHSETDFQTLLVELNFVKEWKYSVEKEALTRILKEDDRSALEIHLIQIGTSVDRMLGQLKFENYGTVYHEAVQCSASECLEYLLSLRLSRTTPHQPDDNGDTPLHVATIKAVENYRYSEIKCFKLLITRSVGSSIRNNVGDLPIHIAARMFTCVSSDSYWKVANVLQMIIFKDPQCLDSTNLIMETPRKIVNLFLEKNKQFTSYFCYLMKKISSKQISSNTQQLAKIADALWISDRHFNYDLLASEIEKLTELNQTDNWYLGNESLFYVIAERCPAEIVKMFLKRKPDPWIVNCGNGKLPLHAAFYRCDNIILKLLLQIMKEFRPESFLIDIKTYSSSLLIELLRNINISSLHFWRCIELLQVECLIDLSQNLNDDPSLSQIAEKCSHLKEMCTSLNLSQVAKWRNLDRHLNTPNSEADGNISSVTQMLSWETAKKICETDCVEAVVLDFFNSNMNITNFFCIENAPRRNNFIHVAVLFSAIKCLEWACAQVPTHFINRPDEQGKTPLHYALHIGLTANNPCHFQCFIVLLQYGANVNARDNFGDTVLHDLFQFCLKSAENCSQYFLSFADFLINHPSVDPQPQNFNWLLPYDFMYSDHNDRRTSKLYCDLQMKINEEKNLSKCSENMFSCLIRPCPSLQSVRSAINEMSENIIFYIGAKTVLYYMAENFGAGEVQMMLSIGSDPWQCNIDDGNLPILAAVRKGDSQMVDILLSSMKDNSPTKVIDLRSMSCSLIGSIICRWNASNFMKDDTKFDVRGCLQSILRPDVFIDLDRDLICGSSFTVSPIDLAQCVDERLVQILAQKLRVPQTKLITLRITPSFGSLLQESLASDDVNSFQILTTLKEHFDRHNNSIKFQNNQTLFHLAVELRAVECLCFLLQNSTQLLDQPDVNGNSPLHLAVQIRSNGKVSSCMNKHKVLNREQSDVFMGLNFNECCSNTQTCLIYISNTVAIVRLLLRAGIFCNARNNDGDSALHILLKQFQGNEKWSYVILLHCLDLFLALPEIDVDAINNCNMTPTQMLLRNGRLDDKFIMIAYERLIRAGATLQQKILEKPLQTTRYEKRQNIREGFTKLLHYLIAKEYKQIRSILLCSSMADISNYEHYHIGNEKLIFYLVRNFKSSVLEIFLYAGGDPWILNSNGELPLISVFEKGDYYMATIMMQYMKERNLNFELDLQAFTKSLMLSIFTGLQKDCVCSPEINHLSCLRLLQRPDVRIGEISSEIWQEAKALGDLGVLKILARKVIENWTWECATAILENDDVVSLEAKLNSCGDRIELLNRPHRSVQGMTLLHFALDCHVSGTTSCLSLLLQYIRKQEEFLIRTPPKVFNMHSRSYASPLNEPDETGDTVLLKAAKYAAYDVIEKLISCQVDVNSRNNNGDSILDILLNKFADGTSEALIRSLKVLFLSNKLSTVQLSSIKKHCFYAKLLEHDDLNSALLRCPFNCSAGIHSTVLEGDVVALLNYSQHKDVFSSSYIGSVLILSLLLNLNDCQLMEHFFNLGYDPWQPSFDGEILLVASLKQGNARIVGKLVNALKEWSAKDYLDLKECSWKVVSSALLGDKSKLTNRLDVDYNKCIERILQSDVLLDVNSCHNGTSLVEFAAVCGNQLALKLLLKRGAYIGGVYKTNNTSIKAILRSLMCNTLDDVFCECVMATESDDSGHLTTDVANSNFCLHVDCSFLLAPEHYQERFEEKYDSNVSYKLAEIVLEIGEDPNHQINLQTPLMECLLAAKWQSVYNFLVVDAIVTSIFFILLVLQSIFLNVSVIEHAQNISNHLMLAISVILMLLVTVIGAREFVELFTGFKQYFCTLRNYVTWFLIASSVILSFVPMTSTNAAHLSAWTTLISFYELLITFEHVIEGHYIGKFRYTVKNIARYFTWFCVPMLATLLGIWFFSKDKPQGDAEFPYVEHIARVFAMAVGDFTVFFRLSDKLNENNWRSASLLIFFVVFFVMVILAQMILITAMTISDVREFTECVQFHTKQSKWKVIYQCELLLDALKSLQNYLPHIPFLDKHLDHFTRSFQLPNRRFPKILIRINETNPTKRMILSDGIHEYYRTVNDKLTTKFRSLILKNLHR